MTETLPPPMLPIMTPFMPSFSTQQLLPPWHSEGSRNWAFVVETRHWCIQDYLDAWFNAQAPDQAPYYWKAMPSEKHAYGVLLVCDHPKFSSMRQTKGDGTWEAGYEMLAHREVFWFFPALRYERTADNLLVGEPTIVWIQPFALDNNSFVMFSSREIWGCEKDMAHIYLDEESHPDELHIDIALQGCKTFTPKSISHMIGVMHIALKHPTTEFEWAPIMADPDLEKLVLAFLGGIAGRTPDPSTAPNHIEINTLKQFRDAFDMQYAAYRAISSSKVTHTEMADPIFYPGANVTIDFMWSDTCAERWTKLFGLPTPEKDSPVRGHPHGDSHALAKGIDWNMPRVKGTVVMAASFTADSTFEVLDTLFTYGLPSGD